MSLKPQDVHRHNRASWNRATEAHLRHELDTPGFFSRGGSTLFEEELELLGALEGKRLVHLQCNSGKDTVSLAAAGAQVLGVDLSDTAVAAGQRLSASTGIAAEFQESEVVEFLNTTDRRFELAFSSYGAVSWLPDVQAWARGLARVLEPGGAFVLVEFHPFATQMEPTGDGLTQDDLRFCYPMDTPEAELQSGVHDYVASSGEGLLPMGRAADVPAFENDKPCVCFDHSLGTLLQALLEAGLVLEVFREYPWSSGFAVFPFLEEGADRRWRFPEGTHPFPLMFGLRARRPA